jgi:hypothetical protein
MRFWWKDLEYDRVMLHAVKLLESLSKAPYSILYVHSEVAPQHQPPMEWVREVVTLVSRRYSTHLQAILVLQPTWRLKVMLWGLSLSGRDATTCRSTSPGAGLRCRVLSIGSGRGVEAPRVCGRTGWSCRSCQHGRSRRATRGANLLSARD